MGGAEIECWALKALLISAGRDREKMVGLGEGRLNMHFTL